jgi:hypothetical protein
MVVVVVVVVSVVGLDFDASDDALDALESDEFPCEPEADDPEPWVVVVVELDGPL